MCCATGSSRNPRLLRTCDASVPDDRDDHADDRYQPGRLPAAGRRRHVAPSLPPPGGGILAVVEPISSAMDIAPLRPGPDPRSLHTGRQPEPALGQVEPDRPRPKTLSQIEAHDKVLRLTTSDSRIAGPPGDILPSPLREVVRVDALEFVRGLGGDADAEVNHHLGEPLGMGMC